MSLTIIDNISPPAPKWVYEPVPLFRTTLEADRYWAEQYIRWKEGYAGLTGPHYFYLQEVHLKDIYGDIIRPSWRDVDDFIFDNIDACMKSGDGLLLYKRREVGATSVFGGGMPLWFMRMFPGSTINMTSKSQEAVHTMFNDKVMVSYQNVNPEIINPEPINKNFTKQQMYLKIGVKKKDGSGKIAIRESILNCQESSERPTSPTKFSGSRGIYTYVDEGPLHKRIHDLLKSIDATRRKGTELKGFLAIAGTVEHTLTPDQLAAFHKLIKDASFLRLRPALIPAWMGLEQFSINGHSDKKRGMEWIEQEIDRLEKAEDKSFLTAFKKNYPRDEADIFDLSQGGMFEPDVADILNYQYNKLMKDGVHDAAYKIIKMGDDAVASPDAKGSFFISEMPKPGVQYYSCIDGVATGTESGAEKGSRIACIIFKGFDPAGGSFSPVCIYYERPKTIEEGYIKMESQFRFYNKYDGFKRHHGFYYETNAATGDHFATFLRKAGLIEYAAKRSDLSGKGFMDTKKLGQAVTVQVREWQVRQANIFLRKYGQNINMKMLLIDLLNPEEENSDMRDAFFMFMVAIPNFDQPLKKTTERRYRTVHQFVGGRWISKQVPLSGKTAEDSMANTRIQQFIDQMAVKYGSNAYNHKMNESEKMIYDELLGNARRHGNF